MQKWNLKSFCRDWRLVILTGILFLYGIYRAYQIGFAYGPLWGSTLSGIQSVCELAMYGVCLLLPVSFLFLNKSREQDYRELLLGDLRSRSRYLRGRISFLLEIACLYALLLSGTAACLVINSGGVEGILGWHLTKAILLYVWLPMVYSVLLGAVLAWRVNEKAAYLLIILVICGNSSLTEVFKLRLFTTVNLYSIWNYFQVISPDLATAMDEGYGIGMESFRWAVGAFWILLLLLLLLWGNTRRKYWPVKLACGVGALACIPFLVFPERMHQIENLGESGYGEEIYYQEQAARGEIPPEEEAQFYIQAYSLVLKAGRTMEVQASLRLQQAREDLSFTLYHGFTLDGIRDEDGEELEYTREGDYLTVKNPGKDIKQLHLQYHGYSRKFYANSQGIYLPGYFPYYPMAGKRHVYETLYWKNQDVGYRYGGYVKDIDDLPEADFTLWVEGGGPRIFTNLQENGERSFSGKARTLTILGGLLEEIQMGDTQVVKPIDYSLDPQGLTELQESWEEAEKLLQAGLPCPGKLFLLGSAAGGIYVDDIQNSCLMDGYGMVFPMDQMFWAQDMLLGSIKGDGEKEVLRQLLKDRLSYGFSPRKRDYGLEAQEQETEYRTLLAYYLDRAVTERGAEQVMPQVWQYWSNDADSRSPLEVLKNLIGG